MLRELGIELSRAGKGAELLVCPLFSGLTDGVTDDVDSCHPEAVPVDYAGAEGKLKSWRDRCWEIRPADLPTGWAADAPQQVTERTKEGIVQAPNTYLLQGSIPLVHTSVAALIPFYNATC